MNRSANVFKQIQKTQLVAFLAPKTKEDCLTAYEVMTPMGIVLEVAFRTDAALEGIQYTLQKYPDALLLAGTVMTSKQAELAIEAGVAGIISADYISNVVEICAQQDMMAIPGSLGDVGKQLVQKAEIYGCDLSELKEKAPYQWIHKLFPATTEHQNFISVAKAYKAAYKGLQMMYTGGISLNNLESLVQYDPDGIFCGSAITKEINRPDAMEEEAKRWLQLIGKHTKK